MNIQIKRVGYLSKVGNVIIRYSHAGNVKNFNVCQLEEKYWDSDAKKVINRADAEFVNDMIMSKYRDVFFAMNTLKNRRKEPTVKAVTRNVKSYNKSRSSLISLFDDYIGYREKDRLCTKKEISVRKYIKDSDGLGVVDEDYVSEMRRSLLGSGLNPNTVKQYLKSFKGFYDWCRTSRFHSNSTDFILVEIKKVTSITKNKKPNIYLEEFKTMLDYFCENINKYSESKLLTLVAFIVNYEIGLRIGQLKKVRSGMFHIHEDYCIFNSGMVEKSEGSVCTVIKNSLAIKFIKDLKIGKVPNDFLFSGLPHNKTMTRHLREWVRDSGVDRDVSVYSLDSNHKKNVSYVKLHDVVSSHSFRASKVNNIITEKGVGVLPYINQILGWKTPDMYKEYLRSYPDIKMIGIQL